MDAAPTRSRRGPACRASPRARAASESALASRRIVGTSRAASATSSAERGATRLASPVRRSGSARSTRNAQARIATARRSPESAPYTISSTVTSRSISPPGRLRSREDDGVALHRHERVDQREREGDPERADDGRAARARASAARAPPRRRRARAEHDGLPRRERGGDQPGREHEQRAGPHPRTCANDLALRVERDGVAVAHDRGVRAQARPRRGSRRRRSTPET